MFDDLLDAFDRDRRSGDDRPRRGARGGVRGLLSRLMGDHDDDHPDRRSRRYGDDLDDASGMDRSSRRRDRDRFDVDD